MYGTVGRAQRQQPAHTVFDVNRAHTVHVVNNFNFNISILISDALLIELCGVD
jgi:hypothetical protein